MIMNMLKFMNYNSQYIKAKRQANRELLGIKEMLINRYDFKIKWYLKLVSLIVNEKVIWMLDKVRELYCECDEYLGEINLVTGITILEKDVKYTVEDKELKVPTIVCKCPYCEEINYFRGKIE